MGQLPLAVSPSVLLSHGRILCSKIFLLRFVQWCGYCNCVFFLFVCSKVYMFIGKVYMFIGLCSPPSSTTQSGKKGMKAPNLGRNEPRQPTTLITQIVLERIPFQPGESNNLGSGSFWLCWLEGVSHSSFSAGWFHPGSSLFSLQPGAQAWENPLWIKVPSGELSALSSGEMGTKQIMIL